MDAFYEPLDGHRFHSNVATTGPWDARWQHGGPPAALVARALSRLEPASPRHHLARVTVDIIRPVPVVDLQVRAQVVHAGRQVGLLAGSLDAGGQQVLRLTAWRITAAAEPVPAAAEPAGPPPLPPPQPPLAWPGARTEGLISAVEWRFVSGPPEVPGPAEVWARPLPALVAGEESSGLERALILVDSGHGISAVLNSEEWLFINTDLTLLLYRQPVGEWLYLAARTVIDPAGTGMAETRLADQQGWVGRCLQTLLVTRRRW